MTIPEARGECKTALARIPRDILILSILVLASTFSFGLGYLAGLDVAQGQGVQLGTSTLVATSTDGTIVASKSGMKYYLLWCAGTDRISNANKVWFPSALAARGRLYAGGELRRPLTWYNCF